MKTTAIYLDEYYHFSWDHPSKKQRRRRSSLLVLVRQCLGVAINYILFTANVTKVFADLRTSYLDTAFYKPPSQSAISRGLQGIVSSPTSSAITPTSTVTHDGGTLSLSTNYQPNDASFGIMFTIFAKKDITVTSMNIYTNYETSVNIRVYVYTLQGNFEGKEQTPYAWTNICNATITTGILGYKTPIPPGDSTFQKIPVLAGNNQSFYVTLEQPMLSYTDGIENFEHEGGIQNSTADMNVYIGSAVTRYPFQAITPLRKFNGDILYKQGLPPTHPPTASPTVFVQWGEGLKLLSTGFDGNMRGYGAVFTIHSLLKEVQIQTIEFHCAATGEVNVQVYSYPGNFNQTETSDKWKLISNTTLPSSGIGKGTSIPNDAFEPFRIPMGTNHTIYITLNSNNLLYTSSTSLDAVYITDKFLTFYVGKGVSEPFLSSIYDSRVFNGVIHYVTEINNETAVPTPAPISPWIDSFHVDHSLTTTFEGGTGGYGCMFEIRAKNDLVVRSLDVHLANTSTYDVEIWTKEETYVGFESDDTAWREVAKVTIQGTGIGTATQVDPQSFNAIAIPSGSLQSVYVTLRTSELLYTKKTDLFRGDVFSSDNNIEICAGTGMGGYKFVNETYSPRVFNGILHYSVLSESSSNSAPSLAQATVKKDSVLVTQQLIQIDGVTQERLSGQTLGNFEGVTQQFLTDAIRSSGVKILDVVVSPDVTDGDVTQKQRWLRLLRALANNGTIGNETLAANYAVSTGLNETAATNDNVTNSTNNSKQQQQQQRTLGLYTTIAGEYRPPPFIDFNSLVENSFNDKGDVSTKTFINDLKTKDTHFANATAVKTESVKFPLPPEIQSLINKPGLSQTTLYIIYGSCGSFILIVLLLLVIMWYRKKRKQLALLKEEENEIEKFKCAEESEYREGPSYYSGRLHVESYHRLKASHRVGHDEPACSIDKN